MAPWHMVYTCGQEPTMPTHDPTRQQLKECEKCVEDSSSIDVHGRMNLTECLQSLRESGCSYLLTPQPSAGCNSSNCSLQEVGTRGEAPSRSNSVASVVSSAVLDVSADDIDVDEDVATSCSSEDTSETTSLNQEVRRLKVLKSYVGALDVKHGTGRSFDRLTVLACRIFRSPMALLTISDLDRQYCISSRGLDEKASKKSPFCSHSIVCESDVFVIKDASADVRFANDPQVTGPPHLRFYAGASLICPEGYKLGTLCVMDTEPRSTEPDLEQKQSLMELAAIAVETLVDRRKERYSERSDPAQQIACTAHDLLTPLTGIALSLSLLKEDEGLRKKLSEQQRDMIETAANCSTVMNSICQRTMEVFRDQGRRFAPPISNSTDCVPTSSFTICTNARNSSTVSQSRQGANKKLSPRVVNVADLVKNLNMVMEPFPKQVPLIITVDPEVPPEFISDDIKIFRSATNFLTNACAKTECGSIHLKIFTRANADNSPELVFECEDTGPGVDVAKYAYLFKRVQEETDPLRVSRNRTILEDVPEGACRDAVQNTGLGLYSVATQISSIGGKYGFRPRGHSDDDSSDSGSQSGSIFWFSVPLVYPANTIPRSVEGVEQPMIREHESSVRTVHSTGVGQEFHLGKIRDADGVRTRMLGTKVSARCPGSAAVYAADSKSSSVQKEETHPPVPKSSLSTSDPVAGFNSGTKSNSRKRPAPSSECRKNQALVVEDSLVVRKSIARALSKLGFEVTQAVNGMEGLKELQTSLFDVVLCDFLMPVMDGLDCIQQYRQWEAANRPYFRQYIVGISAHASEKDVEQGLKVGMDEFRPKPVTYKELVDLKSGQEFCRVSKELDKLGTEIESLKRRKSLPSPDQLDQNPHMRVCLVAEGSSVISKLAEIATDKNFWKIVTVSDSDDALRLLKIRNWDAVLLDDELSYGRCMAAFRAWEKTHRVNRQKNVAFMSSKFITPPKESSSSFQVPTGFDCALGKPIRLSTLQTFLNKAAEASSCYACDIVTR